MREFFTTLQKGATGLALMFAVGFGFGKLEALPALVIGAFVGTMLKLFVQTSDERQSLMTVLVKNPAELIVAWANAGILINLCVLGMTLSLVVILPLLNYICSGIDAFAFTRDLDFAVIVCLVSFLSALAPAANDDGLWRD